MQDSALIGGVERAIGIAVLAVGLLAAVALLVTILRGVRERGRALSMLRTQGMGSGYGWWLALAELAPLTLAAVVGGAAGGIAIMWLLGDTLGLKLLSGGLAEPPLTPNWTFLAIVGGGILLLLFLAVAAEVLTHRRNKLSEVLRWGESR
jgi:putative ABC transport system permease protein